MIWYCIYRGSKFLWRIFSQHNFNHKIYVIFNTIFSEYYLKPPKSVFYFTGIAKFPSKKFYFIFFWAFVRSSNAEHFCIQQKKVFEYFTILLTTTILYIIFYLQLIRHQPLYFIFNYNFLRLDRLLQYTTVV